jgi:hypothetical protein
LLFVFPFHATFPKWLVRWFWDLLSPRLLLLHQWSQAFLNPPPCPMNSECSPWVGIVTFQAFFTTTLNSSRWLLSKSWIISSSLWAVHIFLSNWGRPSVDFRLLPRQLSSRYCVLWTSSSLSICGPHPVPQPREVLWYSGGGVFIELTFLSLFPWCTDHCLRLFQVKNNYFK